MGSGVADSAIDGLLDRAVRALNAGDRAAATALAGQVLSVDPDNSEAEDLLAASPAGGEIRRLATLFADLVDSTALSTRLEPEAYRLLVSSYRNETVKIIERFGGHVSWIKGDGLFAMFGHPNAHENDVRRAVAAGLEITAAVAELSRRAHRRFGVEIDVRVGIHRGPVYLDIDQHDVYGLAANLTSRLSGLAEPGTVAVSDAVAPLVRPWFELSANPPAVVKGVDYPIAYHRVVTERPDVPPLPQFTLVGRDRERHHLQQSWEHAREGRLAVPAVLLCGEPGIGKTRMAAEAATLARGSGAPVIELSGSALHTDTGLHPVRALLERRCAISRRVGGAERLRLLEEELRSCGMDPVDTVPLLAPVLGIGPEHGYEPAVVEGLTLYERIHATVRRYLLSCIGDGAGLIVAEDAHWFDPSTLELLASLAADADGRLLLVLTGRDGDWREKDWPAAIFELAPLSDEQSDTLIDALHPDVSDAQRAAIRTRCDGVPFYLEHVTAELKVGGPDSRVPEALYEPLLARLPLHAGSLPVLEAAAVIGRSGDRALLRAVVGGPAEQIDQVVDTLVGARVLELVGAENWRFRHELFREVAAEIAPPSLHRTLHARAATALIDTAGEVEPDWRVVAAHYDSALRFDDAVEAYRKASAAARRRAAAPEAIAFLTNALHQLDRCPPGSARDRREIAIRLERGFLLSATQGSWSGEGVREYERCLELAASGGGHEDELFTTLMSLIGYYLPRAELHRAHELLDSLSVRLARDRPWSAPVLASSLGSVAWLKGDFGAARAHLNRALEESSAADPGVLDSAWWVAVDPIAAAHSFLALTHMIDGRLAAADAALAESHGRCDGLAFPRNAHNRAHTYFMEIWVRLECGQLDRAGDLVARLRRHSKQSGLDLWRFVGACEDATVKALRALTEPFDADLLAERAEKLAQRVDGSRDMQLNSYLTFHDAVIGRVLIAAGRHQQARERLEMSLRHAAETGMHFQDAELLRLLAHTSGDWRERHDGLRVALDKARSQDATLFEVRCLLDLFTNGDGSVRPELADAAARLGDQRWPEQSQARTLIA